MAKLTRGKKVKPVRKARTPRQPKSKSTSVTSAYTDELIRLQLFQHIYDREKSILENLNRCIHAFLFIKNPTNVCVATNEGAVKAPVDGRDVFSTPEEVHIAVDPLPETPQTELDTHGIKKSRFEEDRILM